MGFWIGAMITIIAILGVIGIGAIIYAGKELFGKSKIEKERDQYREKIQQNTEHRVKKDFIETTKNKKKNESITRENYKYAIKKSGEKSNNPILEDDMSM
ncbi:MAG: hypothetical protein IKR12_02805 [Clostridia bacterium]|nr:hypothetical protein [Clostridia bacterium]